MRTNFKRAWYAGLLQMMVLCCGCRIVERPLSQERYVADFGESGRVRLTVMQLGGEARESYYFPKIEVTPGRDGTLIVEHDGKSPPPSLYRVGWRDSNGVLHQTPLVREANGAEEQLR